MAGKNTKLGSSSFAKLVYAIGEGEIEGFPNGPERDIYFDSTPIKNADNTYNFKTDADGRLGFEYDYRLGTDSTQTYLPGFSQIENVVGVGVQLKKGTGAITRTITDPDIERCRIIVSHPALQSISKTTGAIYGTTVQYTIEYKPSNGGYITVPIDAVEGKSSSEFQRAYEFELMGNGPWQIRLTRITDDSTNQYLQNDTYWQSYVEIIDEKLTYPNTAVVGVKFDARQFSSIPNVSMRLRGKRVQVPQNYNPVTRTYSGIWNGTFKTAWTDNPAWIFRDLVLNSRYGVARYVSNIAIDPWYLYTVSQYCDTLVPNGNGGTEPRFTCNVYLQNPGGVYEVLNSLASVFRGLIYFAEGQIYVTQDRPSLPVQQFSEANVIQEVDESGQVTSPCFSYSSSAKTARKTVCIANWDDPEQEYRSVVEYLQDDDLLRKLGYNPVDLRLLGVTSRGQALRAAKHTLFSNRYENEKVSFRIAAEGLAASVGEIIQIADPLRQGQRLGGRIVSIDGNRITLDAVLDLNPAIPYTLSLVIPNGETITNPDGTTTTQPKLQVLTVAGFTTLGGASELCDLTTQDSNTLITEAGDVLEGYAREDDNGRSIVTCTGIVQAQRGSLWVLEWTNLNAALYRIVSIAEVDPLIFQVEAIQYNDSKYDYVDNNLPIAIPKDRFTLPSLTVVTSLSAKLVFKNARTQIEAQWRAPQRDNADDLFIRGYAYQWRALGATDWSDSQITQITNTSFAITDYVFGNQYQVRVATVDRLGRQGEWVQADVVSLEALPNLANTAYNAVVRHQNQPDGTQLLIVDAGTCPIPERISGYRLWAYPLNVPTVIPGVKSPEADGWYFLCDIPLTGYYTIAFHAPGQWRIRAAFTSSIFGETPTDYIYDTVERAEIVPPTPSRFTVIENQAARTKRFSWEMPLSAYGSWDQNVVSDIAAYEIRYKQGGLVNSSPSQTWDAGIELFSGGVSAQQQWFETSLFDSDEWTVMIKAVDVTQWRSDDPAYIVVDINSPPLSNIVATSSIDRVNWPGDLVNAQKVNTLTLITQDGKELNTQSSDTFIGILDVYLLVQTDPTKDSSYTWTFDNNFIESSVLITTSAEATYQHSLTALSGSAIPVLQANGNEIWQENDDPIYAEQRDYTNVAAAGQAGGILHPYAPYEKITEDLYRVRTVFRSLDGTTPGTIANLTVDLDYADIVEVFNDVSISSSPLGTRVPLTKTFHEVVVVQVTLQDIGTGAITALVLNKASDAITVKCVDSTGTAVAGLIDMTVAGY